MDVYGLSPLEARGRLHNNLHRDLLERSQDWLYGRQGDRPTGAERKAAVALGRECRLPPGFAFRQPASARWYHNAARRCGLGSARLEGWNRVLIHLEREGPRHGAVVMHLNVEYCRRMGSPHLHVLLPEIV